MNKLYKLLKSYFLFSLAAAALVAGLILLFLGYGTTADWIIGTIASIEVVPLVIGMYKDLRDGSYGIDILAASAIAASVIMHQYWAGIVIVLMLTGGEALENYAESRAKTELTALLSKAPKLAHVVKGRETLDVPVSDVRVGDKLIIKPGEVVPVDATIIDGQANFDESSLTGESQLQLKKIGMDVLSGSINLDGALTVKALRASADSQYEQIIKLVRAAGNSHTPFVRLADRYSIPFTVVSFLIAAGAWVVSGQSIRFLEVLVVATPCPLILAAPIAIISGMSRAARNGIIIKTGSALEKLAEAKTIAFDKTGTLTGGELLVDTVKSYGSYNKKQLLELSAAIEKNSNHVLAKAIEIAAGKAKIKLPKAKNVKEESGLGLSGMVKRAHVLVGRLELLRSHGVKIPNNIKASEIRQTSTWIAVDSQFAGIISFKDEIRREGKSTLKKLRELGFNRIIMVTGDNAATAKEVARKLSIKEVFAEALPADKLRVVEDVKQEERPVVFVGDGVNDAPVLLASDIGIAIGARGETAASESADMVIMPNTLERVAMAVSIAKRTFWIAKQSILGGILLSIILMLIFSTGRFKPIYGAIIQEGVDIVVIFNALRAHTGARRELLK